LYTRALECALLIKFITYMKWILLYGIPSTGNISI